MRVLVIDARGIADWTAASISARPARAGLAPRGNGAVRLGDLLADRITGSSENFGSCSTIAMRLPRRRPKPRSAE